MLLHIPYGIFMWKPLNKRTLFFSLIGAPFGSVNLYVNSHVYGFSWNSGIYRKKFMSIRAVEKKFVVIDTGKKWNWKILYMLEDLLGEKARTKKYLFFRMRCILILKEILSLIGLGYKPRGIEFLPSFYALKVLRMRKNERQENE
jgi:hypothetical protein